MRSAFTPLNPIALAVLALGATALTGTPAAAAGLGDTCEQATDCDEGLTCEVVGGTGCACASPSPSDPADGTPSVPPECDCPEPVEFKACVPGPCETDADCGAGLVCATWEEPCASTRPAVPCSSEDPDCNGAPPPPEEACTPTTYSVCAPRWILPCEEANDCGAGFVCEAVEQCSCSGGGGTPVDPPPPDGGSDSGSGGSDGSEGAPYSEEPDCTCTPSEENWCRPVEVSCTSDADCTDGWACADAGGYDDAPCAVPEPDPSGDGSTPPPNPDCGPPREPAETVGLCQPLGWGGWYGGDRGTSASEENTSSPTLPTPGTGPAPTPTDSESTQGLTEGARAAGGGCMGGELPAWFALSGLALVARRRLVRTNGAG